jgi:TatD DNase family protein
VVERAARAGIDRIISVAESLEDAARAATLAGRFSMVVSTAGVHPHKADDWSETSADRLGGLVEKVRPVAIGEIGIDYHYDFATRDNQHRAFRRQLAVAKSLHLPVIVHCREAYDTLIEILAAEGPLPAGGVIHCFCGNSAQARGLLDMGFHIGMGGMVTFRKADDLRRIVADAIPPDRLLLETDCPYLAPEPKRGRRNEPAYVRYVAEAVARTRQTDLAAVAGQTRRNTMALFGLGPELAPESIAYVLGNSLYLNLTNRCTNDCIFCARAAGEFPLAGYDLRLAREPSPAEIIAAIGQDATDYDEVVFCGYGEPTLRLQTILWVGRWLKEKGIKRIRLNTNGHGNAIHGRSIVADLAGVVDAVSVSLNAASAAEYDRLCRPVDSQYDFDEVCRFIPEAKSAFPEVVATAVAYPGVNMEACRRLAEDNLGVRFRHRLY